ncbi:substrate-binding domain-containing protein [Clostridium sp. AN503]|uniref:substrate-binding domain-containing protein n=1 Tax=Clostridium sp. AN503 TaxID=3160598 RepID=UPI003459C111
MRRSVLKLTAMMMAFMMTAGMVTGCGANGAEKAPDAGAAGSSAAGAETTGTAAAEAGKDKYVIGFSQTGTETEWVTAMSAEIIDSFKESPQFELLFSESQAIQENQIKAVRSYIQQGVDLIVLRPTVTTGWDSVLMEASEAGIPVILAGRRVEMATGDVEDYSLCYVGPDNVRAGEYLVEAMEQCCEALEAPVNIVVLEGTVGASAATERNTGILNAIGKQDKLVVYGSQSAEWTRTKGKEVMEAFLKSAEAEGVKIQGVLAHSDDMGLGAIQAIQEAGLEPGRDIFLMGVDGARGSFEAMAEGKYNATVENPLGYGPALLEICQNYFLEGQAPDSWVVLDNIVWFQEQAAEELPKRTW